MATVKELLAQAEARAEEARKQIEEAKRKADEEIANLRKQAEEQDRAERKKIFDSVNKKIDDAGYSLLDLIQYTNPEYFARLQAPVARPRVSKKPDTYYKDPATGKIWSGAGKPPNYIKEHEDAGKDRADFEYTPTPEELQHILAKKNKGATPESAASATTDATAAPVTDAAATPAATTAPATV